MANKIDLLNLQPTVITRDLSNKYILLAAPQWGLYKVIYKDKIVKTGTLKWESEVKAGCKSPASRNA